MRLCVVCSEKAKGSNFGVISCKACGEFFRRSVVGHRKYQCKGDGNCPIDISIRRPCPRCRFKKCLEKGMQISGVNISEKERKNLEASQEENKPNFYGETLHLETVWANYQELIEIRIETEKRLDPEGYKTADKEGMLKGMYHGTPKIWNLMTRAHTPSVVEFVSKSIEGYHNLTKEERELLLRSFLVYFWWIEGIFRVYKRAPKELYTSLFLVSDTSYMDISRQEMLFEDGNVPPFLVNDLMSLLKKEMKSDRQRSAFLMHDMKLRDYEFAALTELLFWNSTVEGCSDELHKKIHLGRARVMESLEKCYEKYNELEPLVRMGEILNIQSAIFIEIFRCREDMESFKIYDAFESFDFLYKVIKDV